MEVGGEAESRKKLDMRKNETPKQLCKIDDFNKVDEEVNKVLKEKWQQKLAHVEQRRNEFVPEHEHTQTMSQ